jgi:hypothetical protein
LHEGTGVDYQILRLEPDVRWQLAHVLLKRQEGAW